MEKAMTGLGADAALPGGKRGGFTLIEVSLALLVMVLGVLTVFQMFPSGLRSTFDATAETRVSAFADEVLNQVYAEAAAHTNMTEWVAVFSSSVDLGLSDAVQLSSSGWETIEYPAGSGEYVRYRSTSSTVDDWLAQVKLDVYYGKVGGYSQTFYAEVFNYGM
jgi:Tfp pilus assembly protein PilV